MNLIHMVHIKNKDKYKKKILKKIGVLYICYCSEQYQIKCIEMPEAAVEDFSTLFFLHIPCIQSTNMEEPTFPITLTCLCKSKLYCGLHWCYHLLKSLFCTIVCYLYCALYYFSTSVKSLSRVHLI